MEKLHRAKSVGKVQDTLSTFTWSPTQKLTGFRIFKRSFIKLKQLIKSPAIDD